MDILLKEVYSIFHRYQSMMSFCMKNGHSYQIKITENTISIYDCDEENEIFFEMLHLNSIQMRHFINDVRLDFIKHHYIHTHKLQRNLHYLENTRFSLAIDLITPEQLGDAVLHETFASLAHKKDLEKLETEKDIEFLKLVHQNDSEFEQTCFILKSILNRIQKKKSSYQIIINHFENALELIIINNQTNGLLYSNLFKDNENEISMMIEKLKQIFLEDVLISCKTEKKDETCTESIISNRNLQLVIHHQIAKRNQKIINY